MSQKQNTIIEAIESRQTVKVIADHQDSSQMNSGSLELEQIDAMVDSAGWAPFHHPTHVTHRKDNKDVIEPWRVYKLDANGCNQLIQKFDQEDNPGKIPGMLAAADVLLNVTWLPDPDPAYTAPEFKPSERNMEHIAATSAFIQNLLTLATSQGITSYWSSGGVLNLPKYKTLMEIPQSEILLGAIFLFPSATDQHEVKIGKQRENRSPHTAWSKWVSVT